MRRYLELVCAIFVTIVVLLTGCQANQPDLPEEVSFDQLFASPGQYDGKEIVLDGYYSNMEVSMGIWAALTVR
jgi:predicted 2-oxoglutarate/Fe(II)-dependent dioxygenase YbiX